MKLFLADVNHRRCSLLRAGILGAGLACIAYCLISISGLCNDILQSSITILFLGLPTFYVLWVFRTHDVQRQIDKTEENTNNSTFFEYERILEEEKSAPVISGSIKDYDELIKYEYSPEKTALEQLAYLRRETNFDKNRIDSLTRGRDLKGRNFNFARFSGLNLFEVDLTNGRLFKADLSGVNLTKAKLNGILLNGADLSGADLTKAVLGVNLLVGTIYDDETKFSGTSFENKEARDKASMEYRPNKPSKPAKKSSW